jgi:hypothetical protein
MLNVVMLSVVAPKEEEIGRYEGEKEKDIYVEGE